MRYRLLVPNDQLPNAEVDITDRVVRELPRFQELAFELDRVTTPSAGVVTCDNSDGFFEIGEIFLGEITDYIVRVDDENPDGSFTDIFIGIVDDIEYQGNSANIKVKSIVSELIQASVPASAIDLTFTGAPAQFAIELFVNQFTLPGLFFDTAGATALAAAEAGRGINIEVSIPASDRVPFSTLVQELYKVTGLYIYSERGVIRTTRLGAFGGSETEDARFDEEFIISGKTKKRRPILWQKTRWVVPGLNQVVTQLTSKIALGATVDLTTGVSDRELLVRIGPTTRSVALGNSAATPVQDIVDAINADFFPVLVDPAALIPGSFIQITSPPGEDIEVDAGPSAAADAFPIVWDTSPPPDISPAGIVDATYERTMADAFIQDGDAILSKFREKSVETDGLGGKIKHSTEISATESMNDLLGWRGFPRYDIETEVDVLAPIQRAVIEATPLYAIVALEWETGFARGVLVEKVLGEDKAKLRIYSIAEPKERHPGLLVHPEVINRNAFVTIRSHFKLKIEGFLQGDAPQEYLTGNAQSTILINNGGQRPFYYRLVSTDSDCTSPDRLHQVDHVLDSVAGFICGVSTMGDSL